MLCVSTLYTLQAIFLLSPHVIIDSTPPNSAVGRVSLQRTGTTVGAEGPPLRMVTAWPTLPQQQPQPFQLILANLDGRIDDSPLHNLGARRRRQASLIGPEVHGFDHVVDLLEAMVVVDEAPAIAALGDLFPLLQQHFHEGIVRVKVGADHYSDADDGVVAVLGVEDAILGLELAPTDGMLGGH